MRCREGDRQRRLTLAPRPASPTTGSRYRCLSLEGEGEGEVAGEEEDASSANEQGTFALSLLTGVSQDTQTTIKSVDELKEDFWSQLGYPKESRWWEQDSMPADNKTTPVKLQQKTDDRVSVHTDKTQQRWRRGCVIRPWKSPLPHPRPAPIVVLADFMPLEDDVLPPPAGNSIPTTSDRKRNQWATQNLNAIASEPSDGLNFTSKTLRSLEG